jgi:hypothetical protein
VLDRSSGRFEVPAIIDREDYNELTMNQHEFMIYSYFIHDSYSQYESSMNLNQEAMIMNYS